MRCTCTEKPNISIKRFGNFINIFGPFKIYDIDFFFISDSQY